MRTGRGMAWPVLGFVVAAMGLGAGVCRGDFVLIEDFEALQTGAIDGQNGWSAASVASQVVKLGDNQVLEVIVTSGVLHKDALIPAGETRMLFLRFCFEGQHAYSFGMSYLTSPTEIDDFGPELRKVSAQDRLQIHDGQNYEFLTELSPNTWYNLWALINNDSDDTQVWLHSRPWQGAVAADQLEGDGAQTVFDFRTNTTGNLVKFYIKAADGSSGRDPLWIDDIYLENGSSVNLSNPVPEPHSVALLALAAAVVAGRRRRAGRTARG